MTPTERLLTRALTRIRKRVRDRYGEHFADVRPGAACLCHACFIDATATEALDAARRARKDKR
jgi:hypothetical protein